MKYQMINEPSRTIFMGDDDRRLAIVVHPKRHIKWERVLMDTVIVYIDMDTGVEFEVSIYGNGNEVH